MIKNFKWLFLASLAIVACNNNDDETTTEAPLTAGTANFSKYVALGNSLCSGYSDGALFKKGQEGSYANILASQFKLVGGGDFKTPFMSDNLGGFKVGGTVAATTRLYFNGVAPVNVSGTPTTEIAASIASAGPYNNTGVPGAKSFHLLSPSYGSLAGLATKTANPYYVRFAPNATTSVLSYAMSQTPTFFSLWIGNNDVLGYATTGGDGTDPITPSAGPAGVGFDATYTALINTLTSGGAKGVIANIPYVTSAPFFTTVAYNALPGLPAANATSLNQLFAGANQITKTLGQADRFQTIVSSTANTATTGVNPLLIYDESLTNIAPYITAALTPTYGATTAAALGGLYGQCRHATSKDYILLTARGVINTAQAGAPATNNLIGITYPMADKWVLTASEYNEVKTATDAYNATIKSLATSKGLAFVDANAVLAQVASSTGLSFGTFNLSSSYVTGGAFSLDGIHPGPRGYALIANKFIEAINTTYGSNLKGVNLADYMALYPQVIQ